MFKELNGYAVIYMFTSPSNKNYIGQSINFQKRYSNYKSNCPKSVGKYFQAAILKYGGIQNFKLTILSKFEIFEDIKKVFEKLNELEIYYINKYNSQNTGYNLTCGGTKYYKRIVTEETRQKISEQTKGKTKAERIHIPCSHCGNIMTFLPGYLKSRLKSSKNKQLFCSLECARKNYKR